MNKSVSSALPITPKVQAQKHKLNARKNPRWYASVFLFLPLLIYLLISLLFFGPSNFSSINNSMFNPGGDPQLIVWALNWWPFSFIHHLNPFITKYIWYPQGFNLTWATSVPTLAFIMAPMTLIFGATTSFNILALTSPVLSALTCFYLSYFISKNYLGSLIGGYIFGFSSYELGELLGHPSLYVTFLIPLLVLVYLLRMERKIGRLAFICFTGLMLILQFGISTEVFADFILFSILAILLFFIFSAQHRQLLISTCLEFFGAVLLSLLLLSPYVYYLISGYGSVPHTINSPFAFSTDLLNYIVPTPVTQLGGNLFHTTTSHFTGNYSEDGAYIGLPLLIIIVYFGIKYWHKAYTKALTILLAIIAILSLGTKLQINGTNTKLRLPWELAAHTPVIRSALPDRFTMYIFLIAAVTVALWLSYKESTFKTRAKFGLALLSIIFILPSTSHYYWQKTKVPAVFRSALVSKYIKKNSNVVILPYSYLGSSMYYQYASGMWFTQSGGYIGFTPQTFAINPLVRSLYSGTPGPNFKNDLASFCLTNKVSQIIYTPGTSPFLIHSIVSLGWPERTVGDSVIVNVPAAETNFSKS